VNQFYFASTLFHLSLLPELNRTRFSSSTVGLLPGGAVVGFAAGAATVLQFV